MKNLPIQVRIILTIVVIGLLYSGITKVVNPGVDLYNNTKTLALGYDKIVQEQVTDYDGYYLAFIDKQKNADVVGKDLFLKVTSIIMSNRKDGENLAWKWVSENQHIPYEEFTIFYKELSNFISERYEANRLIESKKQSIVQQHNTLLQTFPNNIYNKVLHVEPLVYTFGYVSSETKVKFKK
jgi:hypothetical protein